MRRIAVFLLCIVTIFCLCISASATTGISSIITHATVSSDGTAHVTSTVTVHLEQPLEKLSFPVPADASAVSLNGSRVATHGGAGSRAIDLSNTLGGIAGDFTFTVSYQLSGLVTQDEDQRLQLELPLLSGFSYPVQAMEANISMPGPVTAMPAFTSGYHQANIEKDLSFTVDGATIICRSQKALKDHETLAMKLSVDSQMFPQSVVYAPSLETTNLIAAVCAVLSILYWLLTLRCLVPLGRKRAVPVEGYSAGQIGCVLHMHGADLTLMVLTWAQLGYLVILHDRHGRVRLQKQMEMGNERSAFERRCFNSLFSKRAQVDTASNFYVQQYQKTAALTPNVQGLVKKGSGNIKIFRFLGSLAGLFWGISLGLSLGADAAASWLVAVLCALFGFFSSRYIHHWGWSLFIRDKSRIWISFALCGVWLILGGVSGQFVLSLWAVAVALGIGLLSAFAGRRTAEGRQAMSEIFGLRRYLRSVSAEDIRRLCRQNPDYFHDLAPYALALNADRAFARQFGGEKIPCPYILEEQELVLTAAQWSENMRLIVDTMNVRVHQQPLERIKKVIHGFIK